MILTNWTSLNAPIGTKCYLANGLIEVKEENKIYIFKRTLLYNTSHKEYILNIRKDIDKQQVSRRFLEISISTGKRVRFLITYLLAHSFVPNPNKYRFIGYKDKNVNNYSISNLQWQEKQYQEHYNRKKGKRNGN